MDPLRGLLILLTVLAVNSSEDPEGIFQRETDLPTAILDMLKEGLLVSTPVEEKDVVQAVCQYCHISGSPRCTFFQSPWIKPYSMDISIPFPLARPTLKNRHAICNYSKLRPRYSKDMLPKDSFGYLHRQANAVNQLESWFSMCCSNSTQDEEMSLCCAQQAWEKSLSNFCQEEFSIKTSHYHCCKKNGQARWDCFEVEAPDLLYQPSNQEMAATLPSTNQDFDFNPSSCQKTSVSEIMPRSEMMTEPSADSWMEQKIAIPRIPVSLGDGVPGLAGHHVFSPQFFKPSIPFPLAHPKTTNVRAICQYSNQRTRYYKDTLPRSGFSNLHRQGYAVNQLESWYTVCCNGTKDEELTLCCAQQAWEKSLSDFCENESRIKTRHYHCCKKNGLARLSCFENEALDTSYEPSEPTVLTMLPLTVQGFDFDPNSCQNTSSSERPIKMEYISFPPGRPNTVNIEAICAFHKYRPRYLTNCLPQTGFEWFAHQLKAINSLEKSFTQCCKGNKDIQACAEGKWKKMVDRFCKDEKKNQENQYECCRKQKGEEQYYCFSTTAKNPDYMPLQEQINVSNQPHLDMFCGKYKALQKIKRLPFNVDELADKCCSLVEDERSTCLQKQLDNLLDDACKADDPDVTQINQNCCEKAANGRSNCLTKLLLRKISSGAKVNRRKCPIIS